MRRYLCKLSDQELRQSAARNMADLMWSTVKEPLDSTLCFDKESLDLAFKYFMSPTLTMRLAGLSQITVSPPPPQRGALILKGCFLTCLLLHRTSCTPSTTSATTSRWCPTRKRRSAHLHPCVGLIPASPCSLCPPPPQVHSQGAG